MKENLPLLLGLYFLLSFKKEIEQLDQHGVKIIIITSYLILVSVTTLKCFLSDSFMVELIYFELSHRKSCNDYMCFPHKYWYAVWIFLGKS